MPDARRLSSAMIPAQNVVARVANRAAPGNAESDMYVDLPANTVQYCFRTLTDASAFKQRFGHSAETCATTARS
jgi:hypothetical protein